MIPPLTISRPTLLTTPAPHFGEMTPEEVQKGRESGNFHAKTTKPFSGKTEKGAIPQDTTFHFMDSNSAGTGMYGRPTGENASSVGQGPVLFTDQELKDGFELTENPDVADLKRRLEEKRKRQS